MARIFCLFLSLLCMTITSAFAAEGEPSVSSKPAASQSNDSGLAVQERLPLDLLSKGTDSCGTLLSYKLKEELVGSKLFILTTSEKKKFVLHMATQPEFSDRPEIASNYCITLVYQEDAGNLSYYLEQTQGQVHEKNVPAEMQKILEWAYKIIKRYHYLLED